MKLKFFKPSVSVTLHLNHNPIVLLSILAKVEIPPRSMEQQQLVRGKLWLKAYCALLQHVAGSYTLDCSIRSVCVFRSSSDS